LAEGGTPELPGLRSGYPGLDLTGGFVGLIGLELDEVTPRQVTAHLEVGPGHLQPYGLVHGGVYAAIAETLASVGAALAIGSREPGRGAVGLENHTSFLRVARAGERVEAVAVARHSGRRVQHWTVTMRAASDGRELAVSTVRLLAVDAG
jgi:1,4-dihydroxy-2-naphthoyl-CoA hydrolase